MRIYYEVTFNGLIILQDSVQKATEKAVVEIGRVAVTPAMETVLKDINRIKNK